jgi:8-oxo-dGTP diphosphatase
MSQRIPQHAEAASERVEGRSATVAQEQRPPILRIVSCVAVVVRDGMVLCVRRRENGQWEPPTGVLEGDETLSECAEREVLEETGIVVEAQAVTGIYRNIAAKYQPLAIAWRCAYVAGDPRPTAEAAQAAWLAPEDAVKRMARAIAIRVTDGMAIDDVVLPVRTHDGRNLR